MAFPSAWSPALREAFLAIVRETGNQSEAARRLGHRSMFSNRIKRDAAFRAEVRMARDEADRRLGGTRSAFLPRGSEGAGVPGGAGDGFAQSHGRSRPHAHPRPLPQAGGEGFGAGGGGDGAGLALTLPPGGAGVPPSPAEGRGIPGADEMGGFLRPGRKARQVRPEPVVRRNSKGRWQVTLAREGHMTAEIEAAFLRILAATGNFSASAKAVGFQPNSIKARMKTWLAFAEAVEAALEEASVTLGFSLIAHAHALMRRPGEAAALGIEEEAVPFDPEAAMRIIGFLDRRRDGRTTAGPRKGPPERTLDQAVESILGKIEAIERHEAMMAKRRAEGSAEGGPEGGGS